MSRSRTGTVNGCALTAFILISGSSPLTIPQSNRLATRKYIFSTLFYLTRITQALKRVQELALLLLSLYQCEKHLPLLDKVMCLKDLNPAVRVSLNINFYCGLRSDLSTLMRIVCGEQPYFSITSVWVACVRNIPTQATCVEGRLPLSLGW